MATIGTAQKPEQGQAIAGQLLPLHLLQEVPGYQLPSHTVCLHM